jgi:hypothetical protein
MEAGSNRPELGQADENRRKADRNAAGQQRRKRETRRLLRRCRHDPQHEIWADDLVSTHRHESQFPHIGDCVRLRG